jgi:hypothetical protein
MTLTTLTSARCYKIFRGCEVEILITLSVLCLVFGIMLGLTKND